MTRTCQTCGTSIAERGRGARFCVDCAAERRRETARLASNAYYRRTPESRKAAALRQHYRKKHAWEGLQSLRPLVELLATLEGEPRALALEQLHVQVRELLDPSP